MALPRFPNKITKVKRFLHLSPLCAGGTIIRPEHDSYGGRTLDQEPTCWSLDSVVAITIQLPAVFSPSVWVFLLEDKFFGGKFIY